MVRFKSTTSERNDPVSDMLRLQKLKAERRRIRQSYKRSKIAYVDRLMKMTKYQKWNLYCDILRARGLLNEVPHVTQEGDMVTFMLETDKACAITINRDLNKLFKFDKMSFEKNGRVITTHCTLKWPDIDMSRINSA